MKVSISIFSLIVLLLFSSCSTSLSKTFIQDVNHVIIEFYDADRTTFEVLNTEDIALIQQSIQSISSKNAPAYKCGYSGKMKLYNSDDSLEIEFNLSEDCNHAVFMNNDQLVSKKLSKEGRAFLLSFMEKGKTGAKDDGPIIFQFYGELLPVKLKVEDSISLPYGFKMQRVSGCSVGSAEAKEVKHHNEQALSEMNERYGDNWIKDFETATHLKLSVYAAF